MKKMIFIALLPMFGACKGQAENKQRSETEQTQVSPQIANTDKLITVDVTRDYPEKEIRLQDIADVEYIPLETTNVVLLNNHVHNIRYVSDTLIVAASPTDGYCHFFDGKGRVRSSFTHKGPGGNEYSAMGDVLVDGRNQEIFISDYGLKYRILVYSFEGKYKRTLPLPSQMFWNCPHDYSAEHILCNDSHIESKNPRTQPYVLLSKQTGKISEALPLSFENRLSNRMFLKTEKGAIVAQFVYNPILYYNGKYIIGDISSDTVYAHVPDGGLKPVLARTPLVHDMEEKVLLYPSLKAGRYFFFSTITCEFDFKTKKGFPTTDLVYDYATDKTFKSHLVNIDFPTQELNLNDSGKTQVKCPNTVCQLIPCDKLLEALTEGKLKGRLKEIASTLKEDDNPVLMLLKFKK